MTCTCLGNDTHAAVDSMAAGMAQPPVGEPLEAETTLVPVGQPLPTCAVLLLAPRGPCEVIAAAPSASMHGAAIAPLVSVASNMWEEVDEGEIFVSGDHLARGYTDANATRASFGKGAW